MIIRRAGSWMSRSRETISLKPLPLIREIGLAQPLGRGEFLLDSNVPLSSRVVAEIKEKMNQTYSDKSDSLHGE
jgi:hypothetical protein